MNKKQFENEVEKLEEGIFYLDMEIVIAQNYIEEMSEKKAKAEKKLELLRKKGTNKSEVEKLKKEISYLDEEIAEAHEYIEKMNENKAEIEEELKLLRKKEQSEN